MNDVRRMLREKAEEMRLDPELPGSLKKRARRRRAGNAALVGVIVLGLGIAAFAGARQLVNERPIVPRPAQEPPAEGGGLPVWPSIGQGIDNVAAIDAIQEQVDLGHQPWYLSPRIVAEVFAMDILEWNRDDIEASVRGDDPVQVAIVNPTLAGAMGDVRTMLTMERWRGREDGIFVITHVDAEILDLRSPTPGHDIEGATELTYAGSLHGIRQRLLGLSLGINIEGGFAFGSYESIPPEVELTEGGPSVPLSPGVPQELLGSDSEVVPGPDGEFEIEVSLPDDVPERPGTSVFIKSSDGGKIAVEAFRLGPPGPLPGPSTETEVLPVAVAETRDAILVAANDRDWEGLDALIDPNRFEFSFGGERDPITFWKRLEREGMPVREILATLLSYPGAVYEGLFMWPTASVKDPKDWTEEDIEPLRFIYSEEELEQMRGFDSYYGWRVGIEPDGDWIFFLAGD